MKKLYNKDIISVSFNIGLLIKGLNALLEIICGIMLAFLDPEKMRQVITFISGEELMEDPTDWLMNYLITFGHTFSISVQQFSMFYLLSHGITKFIVIWVSP